MPKITDKERLDWIGKHEGWSLISDDFGRWALVCDGIQNVPDNPNVASYIATTFYIEAKFWQPTVRKAIDAVIKEDRPKKKKKK